MQYGSLTNLIAATYVQDSEPKIGMGCTELAWSDRNPYEIVDIEYNRAGKAVALEVREMAVMADPTKDNRMGHQNWVITSNLVGCRKTLKLRKGRKAGWYSYRDGEWGSKFMLGHAEHYYDWSF